MATIHAPQSRPTASSEERLALKALLLLLSVAAAAPLALALYQVFAIMAR
jgi:hypothetical protein